jgi:signal transduction histidine kinase
VIAYAPGLQSAGEEKDIPELANASQFPLPEDEPIQLTPGTIYGRAYQSGVLLPLPDQQPVEAWVTLFASLKNTFGADELALIQPYLRQLMILIEHQRLSQYQQVSEAAHYLMQTIGQNLSPQQFLDRLQDRFWAPDITLCAIMFYGPQQEDRPHGPFDYAELRGTWSRRVGSGVGVGLRLYLERYTDLLAQLNEQGLVVFQPADMTERIDPLVRGFLQVGRIRRVLFISLYSGVRRVGILALGTQSRRNFGSHELHLYQTISRFLGLNAVADVLRQEHDFVQRARAALLESVTDAVMMVLPPGFGQSMPTVLTINESFTRMFKVNAGAVQGLSLADLLEWMQLRQDVRAGLRAGWSRISVRDPATQSDTFEMTHPDGYPANIEWYSAPVYSNQQVIGRIYTFHDASESRAAAQMRAEFISRMSHELRTPLTSIQGFAELSSTLLESGSGQSAREYLDIILQSARHMNGLISRIIEVTRADMGELQLMPVAIQPGPLIADVVRMYTEMARGRGIRLECEVPDDMPDALVDPSRFIEVLAALVDNAVRHSPKGGQIYISAYAAPAPADLPASAPMEVVTPALVIGVVDEGPGLNPSDAVHIFLPFYRTTETRAAQVPGAGLGLTLARGIVEAHRGKLWAEPRRRGRKGARFLLTLPMAVE